MSIVYALRLNLGPTNPETITVALETLLLRPTGFSPVLWLLIPAFSLPTTPQNFPVLLHCNRNAPLPLLTKNEIYKLKLFLGMGTSPTAHPFTRISYFQTAIR